MQKNADKEGSQHMCSCKLCHVSLSLKLDYSDHATAVNGVIDAFPTLSTGLAICCSQYTFSTTSSIGM